MNPVNGTREKGEVARPDTLAFLSFALSHAACGDGPVEVRVGERCLIEWCQECASLKVFCAPRA